MVSKIKKCYILFYAKKGGYEKYGMALRNKVRFVKDLGYIPVMIDARNINNYDKQLELMLKCDCVYIRKIKYEDKSFTNLLLLEAIKNNMNLISKYGLKHPEEDKRDYQYRIA